MIKMLSITYESDGTDDECATLVVFNEYKDEPPRMINGIVGKHATELYTELVGESN